MMKQATSVQNVPIHTHFLLAGLSFVFGLCVLIFTFVFTSSSVQNSVALQKEFFVDESSQLRFDQIYNNEATQFTPFEQYAVGYTEGAYWFTSQLPHSKSDKQIDQIIEIANSQLDKIDMWFVSDATGEILSKYSTGDATVFKTRPLLHESFLFPIPDNVDSISVYFRVESKGSLKVQTRVWDKSDFIEYEGANKLFLGTFLGFMIAISLISTFLFVSTRNRQFIVYAGYVFCITLAVLIMQGTLFRFVWPESVWFQNRAALFFISVGAVLVIEYSLNVLDVKHHSKLLLKILNTFKYILVGLAVFAMTFPNTILIQSAVLIIAIVSPLLLFSGFYFSLIGHSPARYYSAAWIVLLISVLIAALEKFGLFQLSIDTTHILMVGIVIETMLLAMALAVNYEYQHQKAALAQASADESDRNAQEAKEELSSMQSDTQHDLEYKVEERTLELEIALRELSDANKELERLSSIDTLTDLMNRRFFEKRFLAEARRSRRERTTLSIAMFDIDYFKKINDEYGHMAGDQCLKRFAKVLKENIKRPADVICRYGGEEFVVILPATDFEGASRLMERVRSAVENLTVEFEQSTIKFTVSIGLTSKVLNNEEDREKLVAFADKLLYQAKQSGRNQVVAEQT